jgi:HK97 family phage prohead protease
MKKILPFEIKAVNGNEIEGHGSVFGNVDLGGDIVLPGAFKRSLANHRKEGTMPALLWQHDSTRPIGVWREAFEDEKGLMMRGEFADTQDGRDARTLAQMKAVRGLSIGFQMKDFDFDEDGSRLIKEADLWETSVVTFPMNPKAQIEAIKAQFSTPRDLENYLCEAGCSNKTARNLVHDVLGADEMSAPDQCEADDILIAQQLEQLNERFIVEKLIKLREAING